MAREPISKLEVRAFLCLISLAFFAVTGCCDKTVQGLKAEVSVKDEKIAGLTSEIENIKKEKDETIKELKEEHTKRLSQSEEFDQSKVDNLQKQLDDMKKEHEDRITKNNELHDAKVAQLEGEISNMRLELGATQREKLTLQAASGREPLIKAANSETRQNDAIIFLIIIFLMLIMFLYAVFKLRSAKDRLNLLVMQRASELRRIGARP